MVQSLTRKEVCELADGDDLLFADGFDEAIIGVSLHCPGRAVCVVYDYSKAIEALKKQGMSDVEAVEYFDFNVGGAYVGERTPIFIRSEW